MASIFRRQNQKKRHAPYYIEYTDHFGKRRTVKGFSDKGLSEQLAAKLESEALLRKRGIIDPDQEHFAQQKNSPVDVHLRAFEEKLAARSATHVQRTVQRVRRIVEGCEFTTLGQISADAVQTFLRHLATSEDLGNRTFNHYVQAINSFCNWLVQTKRLMSNPLVGIERLNPEVDVRHKRRALSTDEVGRLVESARSSDAKVQGYDGETRARAYLMSYFTGLRRSEMASLTPASFRLSDENPTVTIEAACSKHRRKDVLPLHPDLVGLLKDWTKGLPKDRTLFPRFDRKKAWLMVKKDLERIGIPYKNADGIADFHAAGRHSYVTGLFRGGVKITDARALARHSDIRMTMKYTHVGLSDQAKALADLSSPVSGLQYIYSDSRGVSGPTESLAVTKCQSDHSPQITENPGKNRGFVVECHSKSAEVVCQDQWRIGDLNP